MEAFIMGKRHNTLSDDIFRNSNYIHTLEQALDIEDFKKEYKDQYDIMLDVYKTLITINNIFFADSNKNKKEKTNEIIDNIEKLIYKSIDDDRAKYSVRTIKALIDSNTRLLYNKFNEWYEKLSYNDNYFDTLKLEIEEEMQKLESIDFDKVIKDTILYEKSKDSNYKIFLSKFNNLYASNNTFIEQYKKDYQDNYGIVLNDENIEDIAFIYNLVASANNAIVKVLTKEKFQEFNINTRSMSEDFYRAYLSSLHIDIKDDTLFQTLSSIFIKELLAITEDLDQNIPFNEVINHYDYYYFIVGMKKVIHCDEIKIQNDLLNKIMKDLKEIEVLIQEQENQEHYKQAFNIVQSIIERNKKIFERIS